MGGSNSPTGRSSPERLPDVINRISDEGVDKIR